MTETKSSITECHEFEIILNTMAEGLYVVNTNGIITRWNKAMERLSGYNADEAIGKSCSLLRCETCADGSFSPETCKLLQQRKCSNVKTTIQCKNGEKLAIIKSACVMQDQEGQPVGIVETITDISSLEQLEQRISMLQQEVHQRFEFHNIIGKCPRMQEVFNLIEMAAASQATVLVNGETGTGKELVAKAIHYHGNRKDGPLVSVNCSALSASLLESELFGHVEGSFTGATRDYIGRFERADRGTILLDEVSEIPISVQVKLLRVLQEREYERVGESVPRSVDVRVIAATNRDLREHVQEGHFREDLFYRLKVFPIELPPLRKRKEDIELLVRFFIDRFNDQTEKNLQGLSPDAMRMIMDYCWPGNVRELENAIEHAFVTCAKGFIGPFDLPVEIRRTDLQRTICREERGTSSQNKSYSSKGLSTNKEQLLELLDECDWNKAEVGRRLGIDRTSVWRRMKKFDIPLDPEK